jgi:hypothetical protein
MVHKEGESIVKPPFQAVFALTGGGRFFALTGKKHTLHETIS